jgi:hypothetical protein
MLLLAHSGHWSSLALYGVPVVIALGAIALGALRGRREASVEDADGQRRSGTHTEAG